MGNTLKANRRTAVSQHCMWSPRDRVEPADQALFEQWALRDGRQPSRWMGVCGGRAGATLGDILDLRADLRRFQESTLDKARDLNARAESGNDAQATKQADEAIKVLKLAGYAIESCNRTIELMDSGTHDAPGGGDIRISARSDSEWRTQFEREGDPEVREAFTRGEFDIADFVRAIANMRSSEIARRVLSVGTNTAGGFTVPTVLMPEILDALVPVSSLLRAGAEIVRVDGESEGGKTFNWAAISTLPTAGWRNENAGVSESDPVFRNVAATPQSLAFYFKVSRELLADGQGLRQALNRAIGAAFAKELDRAGLRGSGTAPEPRGVLNVSGIQPVTNGANGASLATLRYANVMTAVQSVIAADGPMPTAAIMAPRSLIGFGNLIDTTNQPLQRPDTISGMQFVATSQIPVNLTVGTSTDCTEIYVGDFRVVKFVLREQPSIQLLVERFADSGQVAFLCHVRADVIVTYPAALAVVTGVRP